MRSPPIFVAARAIGSFDFAALRPVPSFVPVTPMLPDPSFKTKHRDAERCLPVVDPDTVHAQLGQEYWANDGVVPVFSQWHPHPCRSVLLTCAIFLFGSNLFISFQGLQHAATYRQRSLRGRLFQSRGSGTYTKWITQITCLSFHSGWPQSVKESSGANLATG